MFSICQVLWNPLTKGKQCGNHFHVMTSSWKYINFFSNDDCTIHPMNYARFCCAFLFCWWNPYDLLVCVIQVCIIGSEQSDNYPNVNEVILTNMNKINRYLTMTDKNVVQTSWDGLLIVLYNSSVLYYVTVVVETVPSGGGHFQVNKERFGKWMHSSGTFH